MSEARVVPFFDISKIPDVEDTSREEILRLHRVLRIAVVEYADNAGSFVRATVFTVH